MEKPRLTVEGAAGRMGITQDEVRDLLRRGRLKGSLGGDAPESVTYESVEALVLNGAFTGPLGEMLDRQYAYLTPSHALYAMHTNASGEVAINLRWLADVVLALNAAGAKLAELSPEPPRLTYHRQAPRYLALREALESVRVTRGD